MKKNIGYDASKHTTKTPLFLETSYRVKLCNIVDEILWQRHGFRSDLTSMTIIEKLKPYLKEWSEK